MPGGMGSAIISGSQIWAPFQTDLVRLRLKKSLMVQSKCDGIQATSFNTRILLALLSCFSFCLCWMNGEIACQSSYDLPVRVSLVPQLKYKRMLWYSSPASLPMNSIISKSEDRKLDPACRRSRAVNDYKSLRGPRTRAWGKRVHLYGDYFTKKEACASFAMQEPIFLRFEQ